MGEMGFASACVELNLDRMTGRVFLPSIEPALVVANNLPALIVPDIVAAFTVSSTW